MINTILPLKTPPPKEILHDADVMRVILNAADIPINYCSSDLTFLFVNDAYAKWYGRTPEQIIGKKLSDILGEEGLETIRPYFNRVLKGEHFRYETEVSLSIGYRYLQCSYTPVFNNKGIVTGWVGIVYDMTQRYLLEKTLHENEAVLKLAKEKAEAANIAKSEFLTNMSHEIRTPMNAVVGLSHILSQSMPLTSKQQELIDTLQLSAQSLLSLINDLLDFSKIESNNIDLEYIPYSFSPLISEIISLFSVTAKEKGIAVIYEKLPEAEELFLGDPLRVRQILTNLISNALKFTHEGSITIASSITPSSEPGHIYMHISVKDTGIGIPANKLAVVFDKFMQSDMSISRQYGGSGLGLAISKNLAELMGGSITLKSAPGAGSEFILHLPLEYADTNAIPSSILLHKNRNRLISLNKKIHVLLAEDHQPNILVATTLIETMGWYCDVARTGREVLVKIKKDRSKYDIILMDVQMPDLDGYTTTRLLREDERENGYKRLPIIGVTAHVMKENIDRCLEVGMDDYISKPFDCEVLKQKICTLVDENSDNRMHSFRLPILPAP
jgi:PAS domain S-box-containing protein